MATVTLQQTSFDTAATTSYNSSVNGSPGATFSPAVGDLILTFSAVAASVVLGSMTDSTGEVAFTRVTSIKKNSNADTVIAFISTSFVTTTTARNLTYNCAGDASTGVCQAIYTISGMPRAGIGAIRRSPTEQHGVGFTPSPDLVIPALINNPMVGCVANATNPATLTPPNTWIEDADIGNSLPLGLETTHVNSGFTGTLVTWGSTSPTGYAAIVIELDASIDTFDLTPGTNIMWQDC